LPLDLHQLEARNKAKKLANVRLHEEAWDASNSARHNSLGWGEGRGRTMPPLRDLVSGSLLAPTSAGPSLAGDHSTRMPNRRASCRSTTLSWPIAKCFSRTDLRSAQLRRLNEPRIAAQKRR